MVEKGQWKTAFLCFLRWLVTLILIQKVCCLRREEIELSLVLRCSEACDCCLLADTDRRWTRLLRDETPVWPDLKGQILYSNSWHTPELPRDAVAVYIGKKWTYNTIWSQQWYFLLALDWYESLHWNQMRNRAQKGLRQTLPHLIVQIALFCVWVIMLTDTTSFVSLCSEITAINQSLCKTNSLTQFG